MLSALVWLIFPLTLGLAITSQSLWIDEGFTVWFASHQSFHSFFASLIGSRGAPGDPQFIFYLLYMREWIKLLGASELSLRAANIPFAVIFIYTVSWASRRFFWNAHLWVLFCLSPFFWFYLNEARPYVALMAFSGVASIALLAYLLEPERYHASAPWFCLIALFIGWGMHILAIFLAPALLLLITLAIFRDPRRRQNFLHHWVRPVLCCLPAFVSLGTFYVWVSANGVNKTEGHPGIANLAFAFYEFTGFAGLGPPRNEIRQNHNLSVFLPHWHLLLLGAVALISAVISVSQMAAASRLRRNVIVAVAAGMGIALVFSRWEHFHLLGRHLAALFPLTLVIGMLPPSKFGSPARSRVAGISFIALALVWGISDFRLVFLHNYQKDSYREACSIALARARRDGAVMLWAADSVTAQYYGLNVKQAEFGKGEVSGEAFLAASWTPEQARTYLAGSSVPTILVLGKADPFDSKRGWTQLLEQQPPEEIARLNAFRVFEWRMPRDASSRPPPKNLVVENSLLSNSSPLHRFADP